MFSSLNMKHLLLASLIFISCNALSEVYTWINSEGVRVYGDALHADAKKAELPRLQTISNKKASTPTSDLNTVKLSPKGVEPEFTGYNLLKILYPKQDEMIVASQAGSALVQLHISPALQPGHEITILLNGKEVASGPGLSFEINNIFRGSHLIQARIKDKGRLLISSPKRRIHVQRPSILNR